MSAPVLAEIGTERLISRSIALEDVTPLANPLADAEVVRSISHGGTATEDETVEWVELSFRRNAYEEFDRRTVARKLGFVFERVVPFHCEAVEQHAWEA